MSDRPQLAYRPAARSDEPALWRMLYLAIFVPPGEPSPEPAVVERPEVARYVRGWGRAHDEGVVAVHEGDIVGAAWLRLWSDDDRGYGYLDGSTPELSMAVAPEWRGRGVGTRLLHELLARADVSYPATSLSVSVRNPVLRLYRRVGFEIVMTEGDAVTMRRSRVGAPR
jgi:GNAT superfamily N-acetyltransferase